MDSRIGKLVVISLPLSPLNLRAEEQMRRFLVPVVIVIVILLGLALLTEGSAIVPFLYRNF
jgi:hypothetical protein